MSDDPSGSDGLAVLLNDPLFHRLKAIEQAVENGQASAETLARWRELRQTVASIVDHLSATMLHAPAAERDRLARDWVEAFTDQHWPPATRH